MIHRPRRSFLMSSHAALAATVVALSAACWTIPGDAFAQASSAAAASAALAVSAAAATGQTYAVKPGQSLNDVAGDITGSKDKDVRAKTARALFDANPNAFTAHDINRLKLGAILNLPPTDGGAASAPAAAAVASEPVAQEATPVASESATAAPASNVEAASSPEPVASAPASEAAPATPAPVASAPAQSAPTPSRGGFNPMLIGLAIAVIVVLLLVMRSRKGKRRQDEDAPRVPEPVAPIATATPDIADSLEGKAVQRDQSELNAVAASIESYDAAQSFATPTEEAPEFEAESVKPLEPEAKAKAEPAPTPSVPEPPPVLTPPARAPQQSAPFVPKAPASAHAAFMPPPPLESLKADADVRRAPGEEATLDEAATPEPSLKADRLERSADEAAARDALSKEIFARETQLREAEARQAAAQEEQARHARETAAREISAREAELHEAQKREAEERAASEHDAEDEDAEPPAEHRFPMPKFPQDAIQALGSLDMNLPPRMELTLDLPTGKVTSSGAQTNEPFVPPPVAGKEFEAPSVASQIEAGTAGAASVAGLGATQFAPLSLDFDMGLPKSHTEPLPALTSAQMAAIARNKLELAQEYMELGDLPGARTLLQEVIESNDPATRQRAAALLSTLAPHS